MKKILLFLSMVPLLFSYCKKENNGSVVTTYIDIAYKDDGGNDLLNPSNINYYAPSNIHIFTLIDGVKTEVNNPQMANPHDFMIYKNNSLNQYFIRVFLHETTLLQLNQDTTDTLTCTIEKTNNSEVLTKLWYNGTLKWEVGVPHTITIIK